MAVLAPDFTERLSETYGDESAFSELVFGTRLHGGQRRYVGDRCGQVNYLLPGNSWGKTEFIVRDALYHGWFKEGPERPTSPEAWLQQRYNILVCSYTYPVAEESFNRLCDYYDNRPEVHALIAGINKSESTVTLVNGTVLSWGSLDGRGRLVEAKRCRRIYVDEAGHIPDLSYTLDNILYPRTMGVAGVIDLLGTPKEYSDPYLLEVFEKGKNGGDGFHFAQSGSVVENEFWPAAEKQRVLANPRFVTGWVKCNDDPCDDPLHDPEQGDPVLTPVGKQVILGHFVLEGGLFFNKHHVQRVFSWDGPEPNWLGTDRMWLPPQDGHLYHAAFDLGGNKLRSKGRKKGSDPTVGFVVDYTEKPWRLVRFDYVRGGDADWEEKYSLMEEVYRTYRLPYLTIDSTGNVDSIQEALQNRGVEVEGINFGGNSTRKLDMLRNLQLVMELEWGGSRGVLRSPLIEQLKFELEHYVLPDDQITQDCVMALAMVCFQIAQYELPDFVAGEVF